MNVLACVRLVLAGMVVALVTGCASGPKFAFFSGEALVDNATGLVLELDVTCAHNSYAVRRELVRVSGLN